MWFSSERFPVTFHRRAVLDDAQSGSTGIRRGDFDPAFDFTRVANVRQTTGREIAEAGLAEDSIDCVIRIRDGAQPRTITAADRATLHGSDYEIVTVSPPNRAQRFIEMTLRRQAAGT